MPSPTDPLTYFPLSVARGVAFCNRVEEIKQLQSYINNRRSVLLVSPRRYGKTSLALRAIKDTKLPFVHIDLFSAVDEYDIEKAILKGVESLINRLERFPKKAFTLASDLFSGTHIKVVLSKFGLEIEPSKEDEKPAYRILDILERLEKLSEKTNQQLVLFFDEFQVIREITNTRAMEGVLRQVAQLTRSISFVFSGSHRHLLNELFDDRERPFYKLCERITLDRIAKEAYSKHIQVVAKLRWSKALGERELDAIFSFSERHPYYLNFLCARLLALDFPTVESIKNTWLKYAFEERSQVAAEVDLLSKNQRKLLTILSRSNGTDKPLGRSFIQKTNMSKATVEQSLNFLLRKDYIYMDQNGYTNVLDPLIKTVLSWDNMSDVFEEGY